MKMNIFFSILLIYFFVNNLGLPQPVLYTSLMVPLFYLWLIQIKYNFIITKYFLVFLPFIIVHIINGVDYYSYIISAFYLLVIYIQVTAFYAAVLKNKLKDEHFIKIIRINFILSLVGIFLLYTPYYEIMWTQGVISTGEATRFRMFTYEPSYYSTLLVPFFFYSYFTYINNGRRKNLWLLGMVAFPLIIPFSLGFIATTVIVLLITIIIDLKYVIKKKQVVLLGILASLAMGYVFFTENALINRVNKAIAGGDTSGSGRVVHSTLISFEVASLKSSVFGVGFGQSKLILFGSNIVEQLNWAENQRIINAVGDTIATFGYLGLIIRFWLEIWLFFKTKVYGNIFRISLFLWIFIYQFTGSFITNIAEYFIWVLAFTNIFPQFDFRIIRKIKVFRER